MDATNEDFKTVLEDIKNNGAEKATANIREQMEKLQDLEFFSSVLMVAEEITILLSALKTPHELTIFSDNETDTPKYINCNLIDQESYDEPEKLKSHIDQLLFDNFSHIQIEKYLNGHISCEIVTSSNPEKVKRKLLKNLLTKEMLTHYKKLQLDEALPEKPEKTIKNKI